MKRGATQNNQVKVPPLERARAAWGENLPDWVRELAEACEARTQSVVAGQLGVSASYVNGVLSAKYPSTNGIEQRVRGALMSQTVDCPILGELRRDRCIEEQDKKLTFENPERPRLYRACRGGCPHSRIGEAK